MLYRTTMRTTAGIDRLRKSGSSVSSRAEAVALTLGDSSLLVPSLARGTQLPYMQATVHVGSVPYTGDTDSFLCH